jgi:hypothetical protein
LGYKSQDLNVNDYVSPKDLKIFTSSELEVKILIDGKREKRRV